MLSLGRKTAQEKERLPRFTGQAAIAAICTGFEAGLPRAMGPPPPLRVAAALT